MRYLDLRLPYFPKIGKIPKPFGVVNWLSVIGIICCFLWVAFTAGQNHERAIWEKNKQLQEQAWLKKMSERHGPYYTYFTLKGRHYLITNPADADNPKKWREIK
uniref:Uncharacterized protein n=1 Tax=viral metagenome TaxID=1070528 RepID=A0A6M3JF57_9ZZZZ